jgi:hypothetical protein
MNHTNIILSLELREASNNKRVIIIIYIVFSRIITPLLFTSLVSFYTCRVCAVHKFFFLKFTITITITITHSCNCFFWNLQLQLQLQLRIVVIVFFWNLQLQLQLRIVVIVFFWNLQLQLQLQLRIVVIVFFWNLQLQGQLQLRGVRFLEERLKKAQFMISRTSCSFFEFCAPMTH